MMARWTVNCVWKPPSRKRWVKAARALTFWTGLGLLFSIQVYLLWPEVG
jgi:hypothetical protein